jgi:hypothetical protein
MASASTDRPDSSVPSRKPSPGGASTWPVALVTSSSSCAKSSGAVNARTTKTARIARPAIPARCRRYADQNRASAARRRARTTPRGDSVTAGLVIRGPRQIVSPGR